MHNGSHVKVVNAIAFSIIMITMAQIGFFAQFNSVLFDDEPSLPDVNSHFNSGSGNALNASEEGVNLTLNEIMDDITFQYNQSINDSYDGNGSIWMVDDIASGADDGLISEQNEFMVMGNNLYFEANDRLGSGQELWKSNGTAAGTEIVKDINTGGGQGQIEGLTVMGNHIYFRAYTASHREELWKSDGTGTAAGTMMVKDINPSGSSDPLLPGAVIGSTLYFTADDGTNGRELWKSDGTAAGTMMVKDINPSGASIPQHLTVVGNTLFFKADNGITGSELWKSDGTDLGTILVKDINPTGATSSQPDYLVSMDGNLYFNANDGTNGQELWKSDGTEVGTLMVRDIHTGGSSSSPSELAVVGNTLYFSADSSDGRELWKSDGTFAFTVLVKDINNPGSSSPNQFTVVGENIYFKAEDGINGVELWRSNGTASGTVMVKDIDSSPGGNGLTLGENQMTDSFTIIGDTFFFVANDGTNGYELWKSNGTASGTIMVQDLTPTGDTIIEYLAVLENRLYLKADDGVNGLELFAHDPQGITGLNNDSGATGMTNVTGATSCIASPTLPIGLNIDSSTCTISGTPSFATSNTTYAITAAINGKTCQTTIWLSAAPWGNLTSMVDGADLSLGEVMTPVVLNYYVVNGLGSGSVSWGTDPELPVGMSISDGIITGAPSVYSANQTYAVYANESNYNTTMELWFSVQTINPHTFVENQTIDAIGFHPPFNIGMTYWTVVPTLPVNLVIVAATGEITGLVNGMLSNSSYNVTATHDSGSTENFTIYLESLLDTDGDGLPNELPADYDVAEGPTSGLVVDNDDDGDGLADSVETDTGNYVDVTNTGTDPLNPDTDGDGICDGPNAVLPTCTAGPDLVTNSAGSPPTLVGVNNTAITTLEPHMAISGGIYEISPNLSATLFLDENTGEITGTPTETLANTTFTIWVNHTDGYSSSWNFTIEIMEDSDDDGQPNELPGDYDSSNPDSSGLIEDLDDDDDGFLDTLETDCSSDLLNENDTPEDLDADGICDAMDDDIDGDGLLNSIENDTGVYNSDTDTGTDPRNEDTDGDGVCDGPSVPTNGGCTAGLDAFPLDSAAYKDTDSDGYPDDLYGDSTSTPPLEIDLDDDNDGLADVVEDICGSDSLDYTSNPTDTDGDGICDALDDRVDLPFNMAYSSQEINLNPNQKMEQLLPDISGIGEVYTWEISDELPTGLIFSNNTTSGAAGIISGTPVGLTDTTTFTIWANNSQHSQSFNITITVAAEEIMPEEEVEFNYVWCFPFLLLLLILLIIPLFIEVHNSEQLDKIEFNNNVNEELGFSPEKVKGDGWGKTG